MQHRPSATFRRFPAIERRQTRRRPPARRTADRGRRASSDRRTLFHAPSFSAGVVMGALIVLGAAYLPELVGHDGAAPAGHSTPAAATDDRPELTFEFDDLLRNSRVVADPTRYESEPRAKTDQPEEIIIQAASFRSRDDAERLRAALLLMDLPAATSATNLDTRPWYRVTVGPYDRRVDAERALTRLREKNIAAIWMRRPKQ